MKAIYLAGQLTLESENKSDEITLKAIADELNNNKISHSALVATIPNVYLYLTLAVVPIEHGEVKEKPISKKLASFGLLLMKFSSFSKFFS